MKVTEGVLRIVSIKGKNVCPLKHTDVKANVSGFIGITEVTQIFTNPMDTPIEAEYIFPLPEKSAVFEMLMKIGDKTIKGIVKEKEEAREIYNKAIKKGKRASLLDEERPNIFVQHVGNIMPNDEIKSPADNTFCRLDGNSSIWIGSLTRFNQYHIYLFHTAKEQTIYVDGTTLDAESDRTVQLRHGWNALPYLHDSNLSLRDALAPYYSYASEGDIVKSHDEFAVFSANHRWEGNLTFMQPGRGYMLYRQATSDATLTYTAKVNKAPQRSNDAPLRAPLFTNPRAATTMTLIAKVPLSPDAEGAEEAQPLCAYIGDELVGMAQPQVVDGDTLLFISIQSDAAGELQHLGTLTAPVLLTVDEGQSEKTEKRLINNHIYIFHDGKVYNTQGAAVNTPAKTGAPLPSIKKTSSPSSNE